jgi:hypothetical protein
VPSLWHPLAFSSNPATPRSLNELVRCRFALVST